MQSAVPVGEGAMAAILGLGSEEAENVAAEAAQGEVCQLANENDPSAKCRFRQQGSGGARGSSGQGRWSQAGTAAARVSPFSLRFDGSLPPSKWRARWKM